MPERTKLRLDEVARFHRGITWSKEQEISEPVPGAVPVLRIPNVKSRLDTRDLIWLKDVSSAAISQYAAAENWCLMVGSNGNPARVGNCVYIDKKNEFLFASFLIGVEPFNAEVVTPQYLYRVLSGPEVQRYISDDVQGSTGLSNINLARLQAKAIEWPPFSQQWKVDEILSTVDEAIEQTEALIAKTQQIKAGLMHDLFTRGVTPDGQLRPPREEAPQLYKESPLGWIPKEWELSSLGDEVRFASGYAFKNEELAESGAKVVRISNLHKPDFPYWFYAGRVKNDWIVNDGDLLFSWAGVASSINAHLYRGATALLNQHIYNFHVADHQMKLWCFYWLKFCLPKLRQEIEGGAGQLHLSKAQIEQIAVPMPLPEEREAMLSRFQAVDEKLELDSHALGQLNWQKSGLMADLLSGRVDVLTEAGGEVAA